jgi:hypothetical protein
MSDFYILDENKNPVKVENIHEWTQRMPRTMLPLHVGDDTLDGVRVSTVFLGVDHRYHSAGPPLVFETMIFGGEHDEWQERCSTWSEAEAMHARAIAIVKGEIVETADD